jgi:hypothetical protein
MVEVLPGLRLDRFKLPDSGRNRAVPYGWHTRRRICSRDRRRGRRRGGASGAAEHDGEPHSEPE